MEAALTRVQTESRSPVRRAPKRSRKAWGEGRFWVLASNWVWQVFCRRTSGLWTKLR